MLALGSLGPHICVFKATKAALRTLTSTEIGITAETRLLICAILSDRFAQTGCKNGTNLRVGSPDTPLLIMSLRCLGDTEGRLTAVLSQDRCTVNEARFSDLFHDEIINRDGKVMSLRFPSLK